MENLEEKTEVLDGADESAESQNNLELNDIKGNNITIEDAKATLTHNSDLIQGAINGESKAFNELYLQSYRYVFFVIRQYISDDETTYDAIQETFIKVYKNIGSLREPASYYGWLTSVAKNTAIDILRTKPSETELVYEEKNDVVLKDEQTNKDVSLDIETVLKKLDPQDADLLSLVYYDGMRISQIAKMQGVPKTTVYSRFNKAKKNLKAQLKVHGIDKAIYSGNFVAMITTAIRNIIGTALLSFAIAQQILNSVIGKKSKKELAVAKIIQQHQKKMAMKIASCIVAIAIFTSCFTVLALTDWGKAFTRNVKDTIVETVTEYHYYTDNSSDTSDAGSEEDKGFWESLFGGDDEDDNSQVSTNSNNEQSEESNLNNSSSNSSSNSNSNDFWESIFGPQGNNPFENSSQEDNSHENSNGAASDENTGDNDNTLDGPQSSTSGSSTPTTSTPTTSVPSHTPPTSTPSGTTPNTPTIPTVPDGFVADCDVSEYNVLGNEFSNYNVAMQGDWIYYCAETRSGEADRGLYKVKKDGTQKQHLRNCPNAIEYNYINVVGPWIYYISGGVIKRMLTDGTGDESLGGSNVTTLQVYGNYAYFKFSQSQSNGGGFQKMNLNTLEITNCDQVWFTDKYCIYNDYDNDRYAIYDLKTSPHNYCKH